MKDPMYVFILQCIRSIIIKGFQLLFLVFNNGTVYVLLKLNHVNFINRFLILTLRLNPVEVPITRINGMTQRIVRSTDTTVMTFILKCMF